MDKHAAEMLSCLGRFSFRAKSSQFTLVKVVAVVKTRSWWRDGGGWRGRRFGVKSGFDPDRTQSPQEGEKCAGREGDRGVIFATLIDRFN